MEIVEWEVRKISKGEVREVLQKMKAVGPDDLPVEVWKCPGERAVEFLMKQFNMILDSTKMPEERRKSVMMPIFKDMSDVPSYSNYRGIKVRSHTIKI